MEPLATFVTGFTMFVELNRDVYRFLRQEGVMEGMWRDPDGTGEEPLARYFAASLGAILADRADEVAGPRSTTNVAFERGCNAQIPTD